jgi:molecular chaperone HscB
VPERSFDPFAVFGMPRRLGFDTADLERRYRTLSRESHPDYFHGAPLADRLAALERSARLNAAYQTLRDPAKRVAALLQLEGHATAATFNGHARVPASLLEEVFALNEELDEIRVLRAQGATESAWRSRLARVREPIEAKRAEHEAALEELSARWDASMEVGDIADRDQLLDALQQRLLERNYITNLLNDVDGTLHG